MSDPNETRTSQIPSVLTSFLKYVDGKDSSSLSNDNVQVTFRAALPDTGNAIYSSLVEGSAFSTLDDGEAATIGYAHENGAAAMIDEKKARSICEKEFPELPVISTVDLLTHKVIETVLGKEGQIKVIINALRDARMRVPSHQIDMIVNLIGDEAASTCNSLPRAVRTLK
jgi:predicted nucleic acid-binding protein